MSTTPRGGTVLHRLRLAAQQFGIDIRRYPADRTGLHLVRLLDTYEIDTVLDVGAHTGGYGDLLRRSGYRGRIVSFEPLTGPRAALLHRTQADDTWTVLPYALGDSSGTTELNVAGNAGASSSVLPMLPRHREAAPQSAYTGRQQAEVRRIDELWEQITAPGERIFLKLDVQGYEAHVLRGLGEFADEIAGLQMETSLVPLYEGGLLFDDALARVRGELGMKVMSIVPGFTEPASGRMLQCDLVAFKEGPEAERADRAHQEQALV
ncbi:FkbM family methyltransferase [Streptomyces indicus]|uniref:Methyltransferase, FkbM family n=1 Tax=Streptomyces indicus TaxID=417292 RepID=A0A1G9CI42_9ACTN|nr:FkbM family methyltransferase [Streptomyces indicus]SDK51309.1 methyltransferase, FkbM family [Streptomyces indicus]